MERMIDNMVESEQSGNLTDTLDGRQIHFIVDGCKVKLNFLPEPDDTAIRDVKRMMLGGVKS